MAAAAATAAAAAVDGPFAEGQQLHQLLAFVMEHEHNTEGKYNTDPLAQMDDKIRKRYLKDVRQPVHLALIAEAVAAGRIHSREQLQVCIQLCLINAMAFNHNHSLLHKDARKLLLAFNGECKRRGVPSPSTFDFEGVWTKNVQETALTANVALWEGYAAPQQTGDVPEAASGDADAALVATNQQVSCSALRLQCERKLGAESCEVPRVSRAPCPALPVVSPLYATGR